jgi:hypothetical protein
MVLLSVGTQSPLCMHTLMLAERIIYLHAYMGSGKQTGFSQLQISADINSTIQSQSYLTTDGQLASLSWYQATDCDRDKFLFLINGMCLQRVAVVSLLCGSISDERSDLSFFT